MAIDQLRKLIIVKENPSSITHSVRTAVAAVVSLLVARLFACLKRIGLPSQR
jgi:hypothetical protein